MIQKLLKESRKFSFVQVMRLLRYFTAAKPDAGKDFTSLLEERVRVRPELSLAFPATDVAEIERLPQEDGEHFRMTARFLGLYGESSPLPVFYTEDLIEEAREDMSVSRDFIDVVNGPLYHLLFRCMSKYRPHLRIAEERDEATLEILFSFMGLAVPELRKGLEKPHRLLRYAGIFSQFPRSALGLETLLRDGLYEEKLAVTPCVPRVAEIPEDQRCYLGRSGCRLGVDACIGLQIRDRMGKFRLSIGPLSKDRFHQFLPDGPRYEEACFLTRLYMVDPLECEMEVHLDPADAEHARLGTERWSRLGWNTWLYSGDRRKEDLYTTLPV